MLGNIAAAVTVAAVAARLLSDHRHNQRLARKQREAEVRLDGLDAALEVVPSSSSAQPAVLSQPPSAGRRSTAPFVRLFLASVLLLLSSLPQLLPQFRPDGLEWSHQYSAAAACLALAAGLVSVLSLRSEGEAQAVVAVELEPEEPVQRKPKHNLTGTWIKDRAASDSMAPAIQLAQLNRLVRAAVSMIKGIQIAQTEGGFEMSVFSAIPWFKVRELYPMSGEPCKQRRRDLRRGHHTGRAVITLAGLVRLELEWPDPVGGRGWDEFALAADGALVVQSHIEVGVTVVEYKTVYRKR